MMFRNLMLKLPSLKCSSEYAFSPKCRRRNFRSLSPIQRLRSDLVSNERSSSCSRADQIPIKRDVLLSHLPRKADSRSLCYSKNYYEKKQIADQEQDEIKWNEGQQTIDKKDADEPLFASTSDPIDVEMLEQYELEAARPRSFKSRELINEFTSKSRNVDHCYHLQPNQMRPYGSADNLYSPTLIRPLSSLKYPKKCKKIPIKEPTASVGTVEAKPSRGHRRYSTHQIPDDVRKLSTTKTCVGKEGHSTKNQANNSKQSRDEDKDSIRSDSVKIANLSSILAPRYRSHENHWAARPKRFEFSPPSYHISPQMQEDTLVDIPNAEKLRQRKEEENRKGSLVYKRSYSDMIKLQMKQRADVKESMAGDLVLPVNTDKNCMGCILNAKSNKMLDAFTTLPGKRSLTTRSKTTVLSKDEDAKSILSMAATKQNFVDKRGKSKIAKDTNRCSKAKRSFNPKCENICTPLIRRLKKPKQSLYPYEPPPCTEDEVPKKVYLPSKVKLPVPICTPPPDYRCKEVIKCTEKERADDCMEEKPKVLPKLPSGDCICIDQPPPKYAPKLKKLRFDFKDPPRVCPEPPCPIPRADDTNPYKYKPLKPYVAKDCECVEPPPMTNVNFKRLPKCDIEEVCRPPRVCPPPPACPPRADDCLKLRPKQLPPLGEGTCPCIDIPPPTFAPPIKRLDLHVPEPERPCPPCPPCDCNERADDRLKLRKKKLPKFTPGDCPCEDRPMVDWNPKRLICREDPVDCVVPDPCKAFPRADWGCWEYQDDVCDVLEERCVEKPKCSPTSKPEVCPKKPVCEFSKHARNMIHNRKYSQHSNSNSTAKIDQPSLPENRLSKTHVESYSTTSVPLSKYRIKGKSTKKSLRKELSASSLELINILNELDSTKARKPSSESFLFKPKEEKKLDYQSIIKNIAKCSTYVEKKELMKPVSNQTLKKPKQSKLNVSSRAISTTEQDRTEDQLRKKHELDSKKKCKKIKPTIKALCNRPQCPVIIACKTKSREHNPSCAKDKIPVCCEKEESPYSAYTDNLPDTIKPFTKTRQFNCDRPQYGFYPNFKKEFEPLEDDAKKDKKQFSTSSLPSDMSLPNRLTLKESNVTNEQKSKLINVKTSRTSPDRNSNSGICQIQPKGFLMKTSKPTSIFTSSNFTTKIFTTKIRRPEPMKPKLSKVNQCPDASFEEPKRVPKIECKTVTECKSPEDLLPCGTKTYDNTCVRKAPPFPAFSDCLDEEMEEILSECPLDKDKYLHIQPKHMNPPKKPTHLIKPPPPIQGKIDLMKEQKCLKEKLCLKDEGLSQTCSEFGKPVPLLKTKKLIKYENKECQRVEELKKMGRWPPLTSKSSRKYSTDSRNGCRQFSTLGLNSFGDTNEEKRFAAKRIYIRNYHALTKTKKSVLENDEENIKELTKKVFPGIDEKTKILKLKGNKWRIQNIRVYEQLNQQGNIAKCVKRFYTTSKTKRKRGFIRKVRFTAADPRIRRSQLNIEPLLGRQVQYCRGTRTYKSLPTEQKQLKEEPCKKKSNSKFSLRCSDHKTPVQYAHNLERLQPGQPMLNQQTTYVKEYPRQETINKTLGAEYYKCKHGVNDKGLTLDCKTFYEYYRPRAKINLIKPTGICEDVDIFLKEHKKNDCIEANDADQDQKPDYCEKVKEKLDEICMKECLKSVPCDLPEEERYRICREGCKKICYPDNIESNLDLKCLKTKSIESLKEQLDECLKEPEPCKASDKDVCLEPSKHIECKPKECNKSPKFSYKKIKKSEKDICPKPAKHIECAPAEDCHKPPKACQKKHNECEKDTCLKPTKRIQCEPAEKCNKPPKVCHKKLNDTCLKPSKHIEDCNKPPKVCHKQLKESSKEKAPDRCGDEDVRPKPPTHAEPVCTDVTVKSGSFTPLESLWQKVVNYFKARPNCPEPGDYKKKMLRERAEKAANAAGLVVIDPKCLPADLAKNFRKAQPKNDCRVCPNQDTGDRCASGTRSTSPSPNRRKFSTIYQPCRRYSQRCKNLEEINKLLEEAETKEEQCRFKSVSSPRFLRTVHRFPRNRDMDARNALNMSLDLKLRKRVDISELCSKSESNRKSYFGYSDVLPSRENILERAWRISIEAYNRYNYPRTYNFFNEIFTRVEKSIKSAEDLERLKTEDVLREFDEFVKNKESNNSNTKK